MNAPRTRLEFLAGFWTNCALTVAAVALLSVIADYRVGGRDAISRIERGEISVFWKYDEYSWDYEVGISSSVHSPAFDLSWPTLKQTGLFGLSGWKTRGWCLRIPLWLVCVPFAFGLVVTARWASPRGKGFTLRWLVRHFAGMIAGLAVGLGCAAGLSAIMSLTPEFTSIADFVLRVLIPLAIGCVPAWLIYNWIVCDRRAQNADNCRNCDYNLTGNVSGRCPECGENLAARQ